MIILSNGKKSLLLNKTIITIRPFSVNINLRILFYWIERIKLLLMTGRREGETLFFKQFYLVDKVRKMKTSIVFTDSYLKEYYF